MERQIGELWTSLGDDDEWQTTKHEVAIDGELRQAGGGNTTSNLASMWDEPTQNFCISEKLCASLTSFLPCIIGYKKILTSQFKILHLYRTVYIYIIILIFYQVHILEKSVIVIYFEP